ncbi:LysR family transcriptional regulator [Shewanella eurypsychrophilus]|uniref:LysR family transcriptional regulator n=1 Tax=Shewanella eurypsychrophilus TaxID=2593656 RepID=A0ABX6V9C2_9GAMM|nr:MULTISPECIES: LysR family transcriptional regulator [Shewanella]QFU24060.1 LysR family transcriptional regulator [Shewanella sp. YLB-09]QPG59269.1 LysR family transcriptional regulator [Shewanella eurypsychrophilus]
MNLLHLQALLLAIETGSISAAARQLGKRQSQVSQWISELEIDLGVSFFDRSGNKTSLSQDGEKLLPYLTHSLSQLDKFVQSAQVLAESEPSTLRIGMENYIPDIAFSPALASLFETPNLSIEVYREKVTQLEKDLYEGRTDIILTHESDTLHHTQFDYCRLGYYHEELVCSPLHPLAELSNISLQDLSQYCELVWGDIVHSDENGFSPHYGLFSDINTLIAMLKRGKGFAFLPHEYVSSMISDKQLIPLDCDFEPVGIKRKVEICWRNGLTLSNKGAKAIDAFKQEHLLM